MGVLKDIFDYLTPKRNGAPESNSVSLSDTSRLLEWLGVNPANREAISEATYFTCLKMLSETMGKLPLHYYQKTERGRIKADPTDATYLLTVRPNAYMTPTTLFTTTEFLCEHYGNAYIYINSRLVMDSRYKGHVEYLGLYPMHPSDVTVYLDNAGIFKNENNDKAVFYEYRDPVSGLSYVFTTDEVMHFKTWYSKNGITGEPVRTILADTIATGGEQQNVMSNMYKNGLTASMVMQYTGDLDEKRVKQLQKKFADKLTGAEAAGRVIPIPIGLQLQPLNTSLVDAQFYELKKYSALQIAAAFGIKPNQLNDYDHASYSNSEQQQLSFLVDTMQYRLKMYEEEINAKILLPEQSEAGFYYKFNEKAILRTDSKTQMDTLCEAVQNAIYKPNEARSYLDLDDADGGDILMCNGNYIPLTRVGAAYNAGNTQEGGNGNGTN